MGVAQSKNLFCTRRAVPGPRELGPSVAISRADPGTADYRALAEAAESLHVASARSVGEWAKHSLGRKRRA